eukprot:13040391-Alexandrium_andersonii.AAC.1
MSDCSLVRFKQGQAQRRVRREQAAKVAVDQGDRRSSFCAAFGRGPVSVCFGIGVILSGLARGACCARLRLVVARRRVASMLKVCQCASVTAHNCEM